MKTSTWAKIAGWLQFGLQTAGQATTGGLPHGVFGWVGWLASLATAVAVHGAASTSGAE